MMKTSIAPGENVTVTKKLKETAKAVADRYSMLYSELEQGVALDIADFEFNSEDQAKRGENILCEILARTNPAVVDIVIAEFQKRVEQVIKPVFQVLTDLEKNTSDGAIIKNLQFIQKNLNKQPGESEKLVKELVRQKKSQSWEMVAAAWVELNKFLASIAGLRNETLRLEIDWNRKAGSTPLGRAPTTPMANPQIGPVVRTESEVWVPFEFFSNNWLAGFCRNITNTIIPNCKYPLTVADMELVSKYDELYNQCSLLACHLHDDDKIHPNQLSDIKNHFEELIASQGEFLKEMLVSESARHGTAAPRQSKPVARFENDYKVAVIPANKKRREYNLNLEPELRMLVKEIIKAGGRLSRQDVITKFAATHVNSENYQPEKLLRSETAKKLVKAGLLGTDRSSRTSTFWAQERAD